MHNKTEEQILQDQFFPPSVIATREREEEMEKLKERGYKLNLLGYFTIIPLALGFFLSVVYLSQQWRIIFGVVFITWSGYYGYLQWKYRKDRSSLQQQ